MFGLFMHVGMVVVIRYEGPKGGPGMPEMLTPTSAIMGAGLGKDVALITDGRFSGGSHGFIIGHCTPEAQVSELYLLISFNHLSLLFCSYFYSTGWWSNRFTTRRG